MESEVNAVMMEAEIYKKGWGKTIFSEATNLFNIQKQKLDSLRTKQVEEQEKNKESLRLEKEEILEITEEERLEIQKSLIAQEEADKKKKKKK